MFSIPGKKPPPTATHEARPPSPLSLPPAVGVPSSATRSLLNPLPLRSSLADPKASQSPPQPVKRAHAAQLPSQAALFPSAHTSSSRPSPALRGPPPQAQAAHLARAVGSAQDTKQACAPTSATDQEAQDGQVSKARGEEQNAHGTWRLTGWYWATHGQILRLGIDGKQVHAAYTEQDSGLQLAGPDRPTSALFSNGFACCIGIVLIGERHVGMVHTSLVDKDLPQRVVRLQRQFRRETGGAPECTNLVRFEDGLREALTREQARGGEDFGSSMALEIAQGHKLLSQRRSDGLAPAAESPSQIDSVVEHHHDLLRRAAGALGVSLISLPGKSLFVDQAGTIRSFSTTPAFAPLGPVSAETSDKDG